MDEKITFRPTDSSDPHGQSNGELMVFTDFDRATSMDTRRSRGCYIVMMSGGCVAHRSKAHKSVMLSSAATEYYEASEGCRELTYIRGILEDFYMALPCLLPQCTSITKLALRWVRLQSSVSAKNIFPFVCATSRNAALRNWLVPSQ